MLIFIYLGLITINPFTSSSSITTNDRTSAVGFSNVKVFIFDSNSFRRTSPALRYAKLPFKMNRISSNNISFEFLYDDPSIDAIAIAIAIIDRDRDRGRDRGCHCAICSYGFIFITIPKIKYTIMILGFLCSMRFLSEHIS